MAYRSLREFLTKLEAAGRLARVQAPVSPVLELTEIQTRLLAEGGPAVLFENVRREDGSPYPMSVLTNLFGTVERVAWGMEREPHQLREIGETLAFLRQPEPPGGWREAMGMLPLLRRRHRPWRPADPDLLAGRACAADHLAAGGDQGAGQA